MSLYLVSKSFDRSNVNICYEVIVLVSLLGGCTCILMFLGSLTVTNCEKKRKTEQMRQQGSGLAGRLIAQVSDLTIHHYRWFVFSLTMLRLSGSLRSAGHCKRMWCSNWSNSLPTALNLTTHLSELSSLLSPLWAASLRCARFFSGPTLDQAMAEGAGRAAPGACPRSITWLLQL